MGITGFFIRPALFGTAQKADDLNFKKRRIEEC